MTGATRFASYASVVTLCYFLVWFSIIPIPFIAEETKDQILPLVRALLDQNKCLQLTALCCICIDCSFRGGYWCHSGRIRWRRSDGGYGRSGIVQMRIRNCCMYVYNILSLCGSSKILLCLEGILHCCGFRKYNRRRMI